MPFSIPDACNQSIAAGKCVASIGFWYNRGEYDVTLRADSTATIFDKDNMRSAVLQILPTVLTSFSYSIDRVCQNKDDCARDLVTNEAIEMLQRQYNYSTIMDEVQPLILGPPPTPDNPDLNCYDSNQTVHQCGISTKPGACYISDIISENKRLIECDTELIIGNVYISIYQSYDNYALFNVHCNRSLCNTQSTLQSAKELMFKYSVTKTPDGLLNGSPLIRSTSLMIVMIFILFFNRF